MTLTDTTMKSSLKTFALSIMLGTSLLVAENRLILERTAQTDCRINASMDNEVAGLQFTLVASEGMKITSVHAGAGINDASFMCVWNLLDEHTLRVLVMGRTLVNVIKGSRELLRVNIEGTSSANESVVQLDGAVLSDVKGKGLAVTVQGLTWSETFAGNTPAGQLGNYPNPFNPSTMISYTLNEPSHVRLTVYDILGREVCELVNADVAAGQHRTLWMADDRTISTGVYFARLEVGNQVLVHRMSITH